jgi:hypothetical protein
MLATSPIDQIFMLVLEFRVLILVLPVSFTLSSFLWTEESLIWRLKLFTLQGVSSDNILSIITKWTIWSTYGKITSKCRLAFSQWGLTVLISCLFDILLIFPIPKPHWVDSVGTIEIVFLLKLFLDIFPSSWAPTVRNQLDVVVQIEGSTHTWELFQLVSYCHAHWCLRNDLFITILTYHMWLVLSVLVALTLVKCIPLVITHLLQTTFSFLILKIFRFMSPICIYKRSLLGDVLFIKHGVLLRALSGAKARYVVGPLRLFPVV